jgi:hypothetical protein
MSQVCLRYPIPRGGYYGQFFGFSIRFESDVAAKQDTEEFQNLLQLLRLPPADELLIDERDRTPTITLVRTLTGLKKKLDDPRSNFESHHSLVIGHYAGRVAVHTTGEMALVSSNTSNWVSFDTILKQFHSKCFRDTDVVLILDSCFYGNTKRDMELADRSIEIIASVDTDRKFAFRNSRFARNRSMTLTSLLADEVGKRVRRDLPFISFAEIVGELRRVESSGLPTYHLIKGKVESRIPIDGLPERVRVSTNTGSFIHRNRIIYPGDRDITMQYPPGNLTVEFKLETDASLVEIQRLIYLIRENPASEGLEVTGLYRFQSKKTITFHVPWHVWAQLDGLPGFTLVSEALGRNELKALGRNELEELNRNEMPPPYPATVS